MLKHNPNLKPGEIILEHIMFKVIGKDKYDNPIYEKDAEGNPVVDKVVPYKLPFLKREIISMFKHIQNNPDFKNKKK
jgi:hypothetical protein